ncbi:MAG: hypothetical protein GY696_14255 [Gammaproteobacteria bacterium]|nr:hypothetical protein [Gammaproteobacteria bacterium]
MSCAGHTNAIENAHKLLTCYFKPKDQPVRTVMGLMDTRNTVPGSAAISVALARELGVKIIPSQLKSPPRHKAASWRWWALWPALLWA